MQTLGDRLKAERTKRGLTQSAMAEILGITRSAYSLYESGRREPNVTTLKNIANTLNVTLDDLLGESLLESELSDTIKQQDIIIDKLSDANNTKEDTQKLITTLKELIEREDFLDEKSDFLVQQKRLINSYQKNKKKILKAFDLLNLTGQDKAIEQVELLTKIPEYRKDQNNEEE